MKLLYVKKPRLFVRRLGETFDSRSDLQGMYINADKIIALLPILDDDGEIVKIAFGVEDKVRELGTINEEDFYGIYVEDKIEDLLFQLEK